MDAPQTSVTKNPEPGLPGGLFDLTQAKNSISAIASGDIPYGALVVVDAAGVASLPSAATDITDQKLIKGIAVRRHHFEQNAGDPDRYLDKQSVEVLTKGTIFALLSADVAVGDAVNVRFQNGNEGRFTGTGTGDTGVLNAAGAIVREGGTVAGNPIGVLDINLP